MNDVKTISLYPVDISISSFQNHDKMKDFILKNVYKDFMSNKCNDNNSYTDYVPGAKTIHWNLVSHLYRDEISKFLLNYKFNIEDWNIELSLWYVFSFKNFSCFFHDHMGGYKNKNFSFIHYVQIEKPEHSTIFKNPNYRFIRSTQPTKNASVLPMYFLDDTTQILVNEGDIVFFPSWLEHSTPLFESKKPRIIIAGNVILNPKIADTREGL